MEERDINGGLGADGFHVEELLARAATETLDGEPPPMPLISK
jgi:hypothetical protein